MGSIRRPAVAGSFYLADPNRLAASVDGYLEAASRGEVDVVPRVVVVPHAGHIYSGPVAATAYALIPTEHSRLVLMGPSHFVAVAGVAASSHDGWETPLGVVAVDDDMRALVAREAGVVIDDAAHGGEHSLEVQLPFVQRLLAEPAVLPLVTGDVAPRDAAAALDAGLDAGAFGIISSDLSHYLDYDTARDKDAATARAICALRWEELEWGDACGRTAVQAALIAARNRGWSCRLLDLRSSGDTAGSRDRVVGYGAFVIGPAG